MELDFCILVSHLLFLLMLSLTLKLSMYIDSLCPNRCLAEESEHRVDRVVSSFLAGTVSRPSCALRTWLLALGR